MQTKSSPIAIVGLSALFPGSNTAQGFWRDIVNGRDLISDVPPTRWLIEDHYDPDPKTPDKTYAKRGAFLGDIGFDPMEFGVPPSAINATDTCQLLALIVAKRVLDDALNSQFKEIARERASVILGVTSGQELFLEVASRMQRPVWVKALRESGIPEDEAKVICDRISNSYVPWQENTFPGLLGNVVAGRIANRFDLGGTNCVTDAACASSLSALRMGISELQLGHSDLVITGGADTFNDISMFVCFSKTPALSPTGDCRPFSAKGDGTVLGEGMAMFALKRLEDAERDGNHIYAVIKSVGSSSDGRSKSIYAPLSEGQAKALRRAYDQAGYGPETVELVEAHGTGTVAGDAAEFGGLTQVFAPAAKDGQKQWCAIGSVKSQIGHCKAAAGSGSLFKATLALHNKILPPTLKVEQPNPKLNIGETPFYINTEARPWVRGADHPRRASMSSFGFGGTNFHVALEEYTGPAPKPARWWNAASDLVLISATDAAGLAKQCRELAAKQLPVAHVALESQLGFDASRSHRLAVVAESSADLSQKLKKAAEQIEAGTKSGNLLIAPGVYFSSGAKPGKMAFLFPGQGSQYLGMTADVAMNFDEALHAWDQGSGFAKVAFPPPGFSNEEREAKFRTLTQTENAQPAIGAASAALLAVLTKLGLKPDATGGHSFGEITALYASGGVSLKAMLEIARKRGELMSQASSVPAGMLSVRKDAATVELLLKEWGLAVVVANHNSPQQTVVSGAADAIEEADRRFTAAGLNVTRLPVSTAFHSPLVDSVVPEFKQFLANEPVAAQSIPCYSNRDGQPHPADPEELRKRIAEQIALPVYFQTMIERMYEDGIRTFVEVGPHAVLTSLTKSILGGKPHFAINLDRQGANGVMSLWQGLAQLAVLGVPMNFAALRAGHALEPIENAGASKFLIPINGGNQGRPYPPVGGAAALPAPVKQAPPVQPQVIVKEVIREVAKPMPVSSPAVPPSATRRMAPVVAAAPEALSAYQVFQQSISAAHSNWQDAFSKGHEGYLKAMESAYQSTIGGGGHVALPVAAPARPAAVAAAPVQQPAPVPVAPSVAVAPAPVLVAAAAVAPTANIHKLLLALIADKTGYPEEMLEPAMALEADLGIDSIKRVEIFSALQEKMPGFPEMDQTQIAGLRTIADIIDHLGTSAPPPASVNRKEAVAPPTGNVQPILLALIAEKTGYPEEMLEPSMALEADLGIDSIKRVEIFSALQEKIPSLPEMDQTQIAGLRTIGDIIAHLGTELPPPASRDHKEAVSAPTSNLQPILLALIAEKTGYPEEMLEPSMALEADLGIDSIKRVEIFSALQERVPGMQEMDQTQIAGLRTIGDIIAHLGAELPPPASRDHKEAVPAPTYNLQPILLALISEKTGYPEEMLEPAMALEADLGIDSIKRVEIFSALQERVPGMQEMDQTQIAGLRTIGDILAHIGAGAAVLSTPEQAPAVVAPAAPAANLKPIILALISEKTGYPEEMLEPSMALEADLGIDSIKRVEIFSALQERVPGMQEMDQTQIAALRTIGDIIDHIGGSGVGEPLPHGHGSQITAAPVAPKELSPRFEVATRRVDSYGHITLDKTDGPVFVLDDGNGVAAAIETILNGKGYEAHRTTSAVAGATAVICLAGLQSFETKEQAIAANQTAFEAAKTVSANFAKNGGVFVTVQDTGGDFSSPDPIRAWAGGLTGLAKTAALEWPKARVKAIDIEVAQRTPAQVAAAIIEELLKGGPETEVGLTAAGERLVLEATQAEASGPAHKIDSNSVIVATGGARGVTAISLLKLAQTVSPKIVLLGRTSLEQEPAFCAGIKDQTKLRRAFLTDAQGRGVKLEPAAVAAKASQVLANRTILATMAALQKSGSAVKYLAIDTRNATALNTALDEVRKDWGPITGIVHGAGVLADKRIEDLSIDQFRTVFSTKVDGLLALLEATAKDPINVICLFSSIAARTGNIGQTAYSMANEVLNRVACAESKRRGGAAIVKSMNWGPWDGGMVTPALRKHFEDQGVRLVGLEEGAKLFSDELLHGGIKPVEVVLGGLPKLPNRELRVRIDEHSHPFLVDHTIQNIPVLPAVEAIELFLRCARAQGNQSGPLICTGLKVLRGVMLDKFTSGGNLIFIRPKSNTLFELTSADGTRHYEATVNAGEPASAITMGHLPKSQTGGAPWPNADIYGKMLFHGPAFQVIQSVEGLSSNGIEGTLTGTTDRNWHDGNRHSDAAMLDGGLQLARLWGYHSLGKPTLPTSIGSLWLLRHGVESEPIRCLVSARAVGSSKIVCDIGFVNAGDEMVATMSGVEMHAASGA